MKKLITHVFACFVLLAMALPSHALICTQNFTAAGSDLTPVVLTINIADITCNSGAPINSITLVDNGTDAGNCTTGGGNWYLYSTDVDGTVTSDICPIDFSGTDVTGFTTIVITGYDDPADGINDNITIDVNLEVDFLATCTPPTYTATVVEDCVSGFSVEVNITDMGDSGSINITDGTTTVGTATMAGIVTVGPFTNGTPVDITLEHATDPICNQTTPGLVNTTVCPTVATVTCGVATNETHCYDNNDANTWLYTSSDGTSPLNIAFNAGQMEGCCDDIIIYDGVDNTAPVLYSGNNGGDLTGLAFNSTGPNLFIEFAADGSVSCVSSGYTNIDWDVNCLTCTSPVTDPVLVLDNCGTGIFIVRYNVTDLGSGTPAFVDANGNFPSTPAVLGLNQLGPFPSGTVLDITLEHGTDPVCDVALGIVTFTCPYTCSGTPLLTEYFGTGALPAGWTNSGGWEFDCLANGGPDYGAIGVCDNTFDGGGATHMDFSGGNGGNETLQSPIICSENLVDLTFDWFSNNIDDAAQNILYVDISADGGNTWTTEGTYSGNNAAWQNITVDLSAYTAGALHAFRFRTEISATGSAYYNDFIIDNICFNGDASTACCTPPTATATVVEDCVAGFTVDVNITDMGDAASINITDGTTTIGTATMAGIVNVGPFTNGTPVDITLEHDTNPQCNLSLPGNVNPTVCPIVETVMCGGAPATSVFCYGPNEAQTWLYTSSDGTSVLQLVVNGGFTEAGWDELVIYDGTDNTAPILYQADGDHTGATITSTGPNLFVEIQSDGSVQCTNSGYDPLDWAVNCLSCIAPTATATVVEDCVAGFTVDVVITDMGDAASIAITDGTSTLATATMAGTYNVGPFTNGVAVDITLEHDSDALCNLSLPGNVNPTTCPTIVTCGTVFNSGDFCYDSNETQEWILQSSDGSPLNLYVNSGFFEAGWDYLQIYDGSDNTGALLLDGDDNQAGTIVTAASGNMYVTVSSDGSVSCQNQAYDPLNFDVFCGEVAPGSTDACTPADAGIMSTGSNRWLNLYAGGDIIASVFDSEAMGMINASFWLDSDANRMDVPTLQNYLVRNITITVATQPAAPVNVRLYFTGGEYSMLQGATETTNVTLTTGDLLITKFDNASCSTDHLAAEASAAGALQTLVPNNAQGTFGTTANYLETTVSSFSEFFIHEDGGVTIPVEMTYFTGKAQDRGNLLEWETAAEIENDKFELQSSFDGGQNFRTIAVIDGAGNSINPIQYEFLDENYGKSTYYRLKQVDFDGTFTYSEIINIKRVKGFDLISAFPNPTRGEVSVVLNSEVSSDVNITVTDVLGKVVQLNSFQVASGEQTLNVSFNGLADGVYYMTIDNGATQIVEKVVKQ